MATWDDKKIPFPFDALAVIIFLPIIWIRDFIFKRVKK